MELRGGEKRPKQVAPGTKSEERLPGRAEPIKKATGPSWAEDREAKGRSKCEELTTSGTGSRWLNALGESGKPMDMESSAGEEASDENLLHGSEEDSK